MKITIIKNKTCEWTEVEWAEDVFWETECGNAFQLITGIPSNNKMVYCPYCGKKIVEKRLKDIGE